jgi:UDPglucose 6-dehydrogenase
MNVAILGAGYVGLVTGLCLAERGHRISCVDVDGEKIAGLASGAVPFHEAGLDSLLERHLGRRFFPTTDLAQAIRDAELTMIAVGTPLEDGAISLRFVADAAASIGHALAHKPDYHVVVVKSTVVPGTTEGLVRDVLERTSGKRSGQDFGLGMNPEFLREGEAVDDFQHPDRIVLGGIDERSLERMAALYAPWTGVTVIRTKPNTAEMIKYASNALLSTLISLSNEIGNLCAAAPGVDVLDVLSAVHLDKRISPILADGTRVTPSITAYLKAGCGFGGSCFPKDVKALIRWGAEHDRSTRLLSAVMDTNEKQPAEMLGLLAKHFPELAGRRVAVLGLAFKAGTDDIRESPALRIVRDLVDAGADVIAYDPVAVPAARRVLGDRGVRYAASLREAIDEADAVLLVTAWPEFQQLQQLIATLASPPVVVDGRRVLNRRSMPRYEGIGLGAAAERAVAGSDAPSATAGGRR